MQIDPTLTAAAAGILFTILSALAGMAYRNVIKRISELKKQTQRDAESRRDIEKEVLTLWNFLFGVDADPEDMGLSTSIEDRFDEVDQCFERLDARLDDIENQQTGLIDRIEELHEEQLAAIERRDES